MVILDIHYEGRRKDQSLEDLIKYGPIAISIVPYQIDHFPEDIEKLKDALGIPGNLLGQQGMNHYCRYNHKLFNRDIVDPWHENYCLYGRSIPKSEQKDFMERGKDVLGKRLGVEPLIYTPPNHLYDESTLEAAEELGFKYFTDTNIVGLRPYRNGKLVIVPELKFNPKNLDFDDEEVIYIHFKDYPEELRELLKKELKSFNNIIPQKIPVKTIEWNRILEHGYKYIKDIKRAIKRDW